VTERSQIGEVAVRYYPLLYECFFRAAFMGNTGEMASEFLRSSGIAVPEEDPSVETDLAKALRKATPEFVTKLLGSHVDDDSEGNYHSIDPVQSEEFIDVKAWIQR
jgi:hypothetical protein